MRQQLFQVIKRKYMANSNYVYKKELPQVFMDVKVNDLPAERVVIELSENIVPKTTENFLSLMKGVTLNNQLTSYENSQVSRVIPGFGVQMGGLKGGDMSIYGKSFEDESYSIPHDQEGIVTMLNDGPDTNSSQFLITFNPLPHMDYNNVAFGKVIQGNQFIQSLDQYGNAQGKLSANIVIQKCGQL